MLEVTGSLCFDSSYSGAKSSIAIQRQQNPVHFNTARYRLLTWCMALAPLSGKSICRRALHWQLALAAGQQRLAVPSGKSIGVSTAPFTIHGTRLHCRPHLHSALSADR